MTYTTQFNLASDATFRQRVEMAALDYCMDVESEAANTAGHALRLQKALQVIFDPAGAAAAIALIICAHDAALVAGSTDAAIKNDVASVWNLLAGL